MLQADINCVVNQAELQSIMHTSLLRSVWPMLRILLSVKMFDEPNMIQACVAWFIYNHSSRRSETRTATPGMHKHHDQDIFNEQQTINEKSSPTSLNIFT